MLFTSARMISTLNSFGGPAECGYQTPLTHPRTPNSRLFSIYKRRHLSTGLSKCAILTRKWPFLCWYDKSDPFWDISLTGFCPYFKNLMKYSHCVIRLLIIRSPPIFAHAKTAPAQRFLVSQNGDESKDWAAIKPNNMKLRGWDMFTLKFIHLLECLRDECLYEANLKENMFMPGPVISW